MATNVYFNQYNYFNEQELIDDLVIESIQIYGMDVTYVARSIQERDNILNEDDLSIFRDAYEFEVYVKSVDGFAGEGDFLSRFGLQIRDQVTFSVARRTFERYVTRKDTARERPYEGDLIYFPLNDKFYKIMHVEHESVFYQSGALQVFDLKCELFEYSNERFDTKVDYIDEYWDDYKTTDVSDLTTLKTRDPIANNIDFEEAGDDIIDFTEIDPFSENITQPTNYPATADSSKITADSTRLTADIQ